MTEPPESEELPGLEDIPQQFRPHEIFEALNRHQVEYIVIGGMAAIVHGAEVSTQDVDVVVEQSKANLDRAAAALQDLEATRITNSSAHDMAGEPAPANAYQLTDRVEMFRTPAGRVDIIREATVIGGYQDIGPRAQAYLLRGHEVYVADLDTVIRAKEASDRPKDRLHLLAIYDLRHALGGPPAPAPERPVTERLDRATTLRITEPVRGHPPARTTEPRVDPEVAANLKQARAAKDLLDDQERAAQQRRNDAARDADADRAAEATRRAERDAGR